LLRIVQQVSKHPALTALKEIVTGRVQFGHLVLQSGWLWRIVEELRPFPAPPAKRSERLAPQKTKKPTWRNTRRYSATSAYSSTSPSANPSCSSFSHPTTLCTIIQPGLGNAMALG
jgi:hypothetical protein